MEKIVNLNGIDYTFKSQQDLDVSLDLVKKEDDISFYKVAFSWKEKVIPTEIVMTYNIPCVDMHGNWDPIGRYRQLGWFNTAPQTESRLASGMPLRMVTSKNGNNKYMITVSDVKTPLSIAIGATEFAGKGGCKIKFFTLLTSPIDYYEAIIRIDEREIAFSDAVQEARAWFNDLGYKSSYTPDLAKMPMYSTWYSYWQHVSAKPLYTECKQALKAGMKTIIIDDGWQTVNAGKMYGFCGDWKPAYSKFGNMRSVVDKIHKIGMKVMLWFPVPYIGKWTNILKRFEGKYLRERPEVNCFVLDPRYKEVRDYLVDLYKEVVVKWDLDGLKLDFIDRFLSNGEVSEGMDYTSVEDATEDLLKTINIELKKINPEILIEYRQPYFGPVVSSYGNMMRVWDCPVDGGSNRLQTLNLRLISGGCAVHSDMVIWHPMDTQESVAVQLLDTLFSVPQISVRMNELADVHKAVLTNYLQFWNEHRKTLLEGKFEVKDPENFYTSASSSLNGETVFLAIADNVYTMKPKDNVAYVFNTTSKNIILKSKKDKYYYEVFDCAGNRVCRKTKVKSDIAEIYVPMAGKLVITRV